MRFWTMGAIMPVERFCTEELMRLAANGVAKVDLMGSRGITLCTMNEIEAMAGVVALSGLLPPPGQAGSVTETPIFKTRRKANAVQATEIRRDGESGP